MQKQRNVEEASRSLPICGDGEDTRGRPKTVFFFSFGCSRNQAITEK